MTAPAADAITSQHPSVPSSEIHRELGHYGITGTLAGRGKFAKVYLAYDLRTGDKVAARISSIDEEDIDTEHKVLRKINNSFSKPYVIKVFEKFTSSKYFVMVMEYCDGGDLEAVIKQRGPLPLELCRRYFHQIATALKCMHSLKVVHRDLKPANVMLTCKDLNQAEVRLIDFGFAKRANLMQSVKGTPAYMAPERLMRETYGFGAEVYAAGLILFEMVFAYQPFAAATSVMGLYAEQEALTIPLTRSSDGEAIPADLQDILARCLAVDVNNRPSIDDILSHPWTSGGSGEGGSAKSSPPPAVVVEAAAQSATSTPPTATVRHVDPSTLSPVPEGASSPQHTSERFKPPTPFRGGASGGNPGGNAHVGPGTPMVKRAAAPLTTLPPAVSLAGSFAGVGVLSNNNSVAGLMTPESAEERHFLILLNGAAAISNVVADNTGIPAPERIVMASYAVQLIEKVAVKLLASQAAAAFDAHCSNHSFSNKSLSLRPQNTSFALTSMASVKCVKDRCKAAVRDAMSDLKDPNATTPPPPLLLLAYVRRALLVAARQEFLKNPHCVFGPVLEVYGRCDDILSVLELDEAVIEGGAVKSVGRLKERLSDRLVAAQSSAGAFAGFSAAELFSATRLAVTA